MAKNFENVKKSEYPGEISPVLKPITFVMILLGIIFFYIVYIAFL